ncbi:MAG: DUF6438 domain-containing protein [Flavobacterium sp.]
MKNLLLILLTLCVFSCKKEQKFTLAQHTPSGIDSLDTDSEVEACMRKIDSNYSYFHLKHFSKLGPDDGFVDSTNMAYAKQLGIDKTFYKTDFNNDGLTDILAIGGYEVTSTGFDGVRYYFDANVIMNGGKRKSTIVPLLKNHGKAFVPEIRKTDSLPLIVLHQPRRIDNRYRGFTKKDGFVRAKDSAQVKLIYNSGHFVEYNPTPAHHNITKIQFDASPCFGVCPWFEMVLERSKDSWFIAKSYNFGKPKFVDDTPFKEEGTFKTTVSNAGFDDLTTLLNYIDFENLRESYTVNHTDAPSASIIITYDDGKTKRIHDYGQNGTYGLQAFYQKMMDLRFSEKWEKAKEPEGIRMKQFAY